MEKFDWQLVIGKLGDEQRRLQKAQNSASTSWFVWAILSDAYVNERRICELSSMIRSCEEMILLDEIDASMTGDYAFIPVPISENALRARIRSAESTDITQETMQDAIDCALSRLKKRVLQGNAVFASLERFAASVPAHFPVVSSPIVPAPAMTDKEEQVPSILVAPSTTTTETSDESCVIS